MFYGMNRRTAGLTHFLFLFLCAMAMTWAAIFLDSLSVDWQGGLGWVEYSEAQFMGGSTAWGRFNDSTWIAATFNGTQVSYYGNGIELIPWNYTSIVDDNEAEYHAMTQELGLDQVSYLWYKSPPMSEGSHLVNLTAITQGAAIDYVVVQPSRTQNLNGQVLIVDQNDPLVKYTGGWKETSDRYPRIPSRVVTPFNGTVHTTNKAGDILQFPFTGSAVRVYGFFDWTVSGEFSISYTIDDQPAELARYPLTGTKQGSYLVQPNFLFYTKIVPAGDHVLTINVTDITGGQKVMIDNIQYKAAFDTVSTMPQVSIPDPMKPSASVSPSPSPSAITPVTGSKVNAGAIVGGVVGGVFGLALIIAAAVLLHRKQRTDLQLKAPFSGYQEPKPNSYVVTEPFVPPTPPPGATRLEWNNGSSNQVNIPSTKAGLFLGSTASLPNATERDTRVDNLERRVQELTRQTEQLYSPPPYQ